MRFSALLIAGFSALCAAQTQDASVVDAPVTENNPHVIYAANLPKDPFYTGQLNGNIRGYVHAHRGDGGKGVKFKVHFENIPNKGGPFTYHIHAQPVPEDGNCTKTLAHLDPYNRGDTTPCDSTKPQTCQVGDLSGKHGHIAKEPFHSDYVDYYTSLDPNSPSFVGDKSIVVHFADKKRITCANFKLVPGCPA